MSVLEFIGKERCRALLVGVALVIVGATSADGPNPNAPDAIVIDAAEAADTDPPLGERYLFNEDEGKTAEEKAHLAETYSEFAGVLSSQGDTAGACLFLRKAIEYFAELGEMAEADAASEEMSAFGCR